MNAYNYYFTNFNTFYIAKIQKVTPKVCRKAGVQSVFQQKTTPRGLLTRVKGPQKTIDKGVVYQIPCAQCDEVYIGETGRPLKTRISEHKRAVATGDVRNANATHWMKTNHNMDWRQHT